MKPYWGEKIYWKHRPALDSSVVQYIYTINSRFPTAHICDASILTTFGAVLSIAKNNKHTQYPQWCTIDLCKQNSHICEIDLPYRKTIQISLLQDNRLSGPHLVCLFHPSLYLLFLRTPNIFFIHQTVFPHTQRKIITHTFSILKSSFKNFNYKLGSLEIDRESW